MCMLEKLVRSSLIMGWLGQCWLICCLLYVLQEIQQPLVPLIWFVKITGMACPFHHHYLVIR